jgi:hypothetical protein
MCALSVDDATGRLLVLGDTGTADQEDLCAVYGSALDADLVVTPPGGAISAVLLAPASSRCRSSRGCRPLRHPLATRSIGPAPTAT